MIEAVPAPVCRDAVIDRCQGVVQHAQRPVLIVRPGPDDLDRVLVGYDGSPQAKRAVQFLDRLNLKPDVVIELAYVVEPFVPPKGGGARIGGKDMIPSGEQLAAVIGDVG